MDCLVVGVLKEVVLWWHPDLIPFWFLKNDFRLQVKKRFLFWKMRSFVNCLRHEQSSNNDETQLWIIFNLAIFLPFNIIKLYSKRFFFLIENVSRHHVGGEMVKQKSYLRFWEITVEYKTWTILTWTSETFQHSRAISILAFPLFLLFEVKKNFLTIKISVVMIFFFRFFTSNFTSSFQPASLQAFTWHLEFDRILKRYPKTVIVSLNVLSFPFHWLLFFQILEWISFISMFQWRASWQNSWRFLCCFSAKLVFVAKHEITFEEIFFEHAFYLLFNWAVRRERGKTIVPTHDNLKLFRLGMGRFNRFAVFLTELLGSLADRMQDQRKLLLGGFHELCWLSRWEKLKCHFLKNKIRSKKLVFLLQRFKMIFWKNAMNKSMHVIKTNV